MLSENLKKKATEIIGSRYFFPVCLLVLLSFAARYVYYRSLNGIALCPDSYEYIRAADYLGSLRLEVSRVPVYPLLIKAAWLFLPQFPRESSVVILQAALSSLSAILVFIAGAYFFKSKAKSFVFTLIYALNVFLISWDFMVLTESLTIFMMTLLSISIILYIKKGTVPYAVVIYAVSLVLLFLKPFYLILPVMLFVIILVYDLVRKNIRLSLITGLAAMAVVYGSVYIYSDINSKQNGFFGISDVSVINGLGKILQYDMYDLGQNETIKADIKKEIVKQNGQLPIPKDFILEYGLDKNNYSEISGYIKNIIKNHPVLYVKKTLEYIVHNLPKYTIFTDYNYNLANYRDTSMKTFLVSLNENRYVNNYLVFILMLLSELVVVFYRAIFKKKIEWYWIFIDAIILYQFLMSLIAAHGEYQRLMAPVYIFIFMVAYRLILLLSSGLLVPFTKKIIRRSNYGKSN